MIMAKAATPTTVPAIIIAWAPSVAESSEVTKNSKIYIIKIYTLEPIEGPLFYFNFWWCKLYQCN